MRVSSLKPKALRQRLRFVVVLFALSLSVVPLLSRAQEAAKLRTGR